MGKLVEQTLRTMYQGVSRQPSTVRLPGQVEDAENVMFSVVSGGFSKRPGTQFFAETLLTYNDHAFYSYERDSNEKYLVVIGYNGVSNPTSSSAQATIKVYWYCSYSDSNFNSIKLFSYTKPFSGLIFRNRWRHNLYS